MTVSIAVAAPGTRAGEDEDATATIPVELTPRTAERARIAGTDGRAQPATDVGSALIDTLEYGRHDDASGMRFAPRADGAGQRGELGCAYAVVKPSVRYLPILGGLGPPRFLA